MFVSCLFVWVSRPFLHSNGSLLLADRRNSKTKGAREAETDDSIGLQDVHDMQGALYDVVFVAANLDVLPKFGPEEQNVALVFDRQT
jgi:hypothetical protein